MSTTIYQDTNNSRDALFESMGTVDPDVIAHVINPAFMGGPKWPSMRQAFSIIRNDETVKVVSTGLSDPFDDVDEPNNGFKLEVIAETREDLGDDVASSWLFKLVYSISQQAAHSGQIAKFVNEYGVVTMELFAQGCGLEALQNENGMVGVMLGVEHPDLPKVVPFPAEDIVLVTVQVLTVDELEYVAEKREEGRRHLHELMKTTGLYHLIIPGRKSLLQSEASIPEKRWWQFWK